MFTSEKISKKVTNYYMVSNGFKMNVGYSVKGELYVYECCGLSDEEKAALTKFAMEV